MQTKTVVPGKVDKENNSNRKFKIKKEKGTEVDISIEIVDEGVYEVVKLSIDSLPATMNDGKPITWYNNFAIKKNGEHINQRYFVTVPGIKPTDVVIFDGNGNPYYYTGTVTNDTFEMTDGDPAVGNA